MSRTQFLFAQLFFILTLINGILYAQWEIRYPRIPAEAITDIVFTTDQTGFFSNSAGSIFKTSNGGNSWHPKIHLPRDFIKQVVFINSQIGFALAPYSFIGDNINLLKTTDGGETWQSFHFDLSDAITILPFTEATCLKSTEAGEISKTTDAFATWSQKYIMPYFLDDDVWIPYGEITSLNILPDSSILALGNNYLARNAGIISDSISFIMISPDSGESWQRMWSGSPYIFRAIHFVDDQVGWMGGEWNTIMKTNDGGNTWSIQFQDSLDQEGIVSVFALDTMNIFAVSKDGILYHSLDGGANWNGASLYSGAGQLNEILFTTSLNGFIVGSPGKFFETQDGGISWQPVDKSYDISVRKIDFIDDQTGWAVGGRNDVGYIFKTTSAGYVWLPQVIDSTVSSISGIEMLDSLNGWAVGKNKVYQTNDGWANWTSFELRPDAHIRGVYFYDHNFGVIFEVFDNSTSQVFNYVTLNGGINWTPYELPSFASFFKVKFTDLNHGWYVNSEGLWFSADTGKTWTLNPNLSLQQGFSFDFINPNSGWVAGTASPQFDQIYRTLDGGASWTMNNLPFSNQINDMFFIDSDRGITAGHEGVIFATTDGGNNWHQEGSFTTNWLKNIATVRDGQTIHIWVAGDRFTILHKTMPVLGVDSDDKNIPNEFHLSQNYPNPFNPATSIQYVTGSRQFVSLKVYDILGKEVASLVDEVKPAGVHKVEFSATGGSVFGGDGSSLASGIYFYRIQVGQFVAVKKMMLIK